MDRITSPTCRSPRLYWQTVPPTWRKEFIRCREWFLLTSLVYLPLSRHHHGHKGLSNKDDDDGDDDDEEEDNNIDDINVDHHNNTEDNYANNDEDEDNDNDVDDAEDNDDDKEDDDNDNENDENDDDHKILQGIVKFGNTEVRQIMKPRLDVHAIEDVIVYSNSRLKIKPRIEFDKEIIVSREKVSYLKSWFNGPE